MDDLYFYKSHCHTFKGWSDFSPIRAYYWQRLKTWFHQHLLLKLPSIISASSYSRKSINLYCAILSQSGKI